MEGHSHDFRIREKDLNWPVSVAELEKRVLQAVLRRNHLIVLMFILRTMPRLGHFPMLSQPEWAAGL